MRLSFKLALGMAVASLLVLALFAATSVFRELDLFDRDMRRDHTVLGETLVRLLRALPEGSATPALFREHGDPTDVSTRWVRVAELETQVPEINVRAALAADEPVIAVTRDRTIFSAFPVKSPDNVLLGALLLEEPIDERDAYVRDTVLRHLVAVGVLLTALFIAATAVGAWAVGSPVRELVRVARAVGSGDLAARSKLKRRDELGLLSTELDAMAMLLSEQRRHLDAETAAREAALAQARHADRLATVGRLAAGIAHELGTPLNVIQARAKMAAHAPGTSEDGRDHLRIVGEQVAHITRIVRQLLDFARPRPPRRALEDVSRLARSVGEMLSHIAKKASVALEVEAGPPAQAFVDAGQVQQVLTNLVVNAVQATPAGGHVKVRAALRDLARPGEAARRWCVLEVEDDGSGIPDDIRERVFDPFFTTKDVGEGTGLGLSVAEGIVREHEGFIEVAGVAPHGSRFTVYLPAAPEGRTP